MSLRQPFGFLLEEKGVLHMTTYLWRRLALAAGVLLAVGPAARADLVPWSYNWTPSTDKVLSDTGMSHLTMTNEKVGTATDSTDIVATNIKTVSTADPKTPDTFTAKAYTLTLTLIDEASKQSGTLAFTGEFNGTASVKSAKIANTFTGLITQVLVLGGNTYTVTIGPFTPPGPPGSSNAGSISAFAEVVVNPNTGEEPEPSSLVLAGLGLAGLGSRFLRRKR